MQIVTAPLRLFTAPTEGLKSTWGESGRSRAMLLGMPALVISILAFAAVGFAQFGNISSLESFYNSAMDKAGVERKQVADELAKGVRLQRQEAAADSEQAQLVEELRGKLKEIEEEQLVYLKKLISIDPENSEYRFKLGQLTYATGYKERAMAMFESIAPEDQPGYGPAHYLLATHYTMLRSKTSMEFRANVEIALKHVDFCLARDPENRNAKLMKAELLKRNNSQAQAYAILSELFEDEPSLFQSLLDLNKGKSDETEKNSLVLEKALGKFNERLRTSEVAQNDRKWVDTWNGLVSCQLQLKRFEESERMLGAEILEYAQKDDGGPRRVHLEQLRSQLYYAWSTDVGGSLDTFATKSRAEQMEIIDFYRKAYLSNERNGFVQQGLTWLANSEYEDVAVAARAIYNPETDPDAPSVVLNQLGTLAMNARDYDKAIRYYERARSKEPNNSAVLNNLSYAYLVSEDQNPSRALQLVDEALRYLPRAAQTPENLSKYYHTKGTALMQLGRLEEATAQFVTAIQARPNNIEILNSLIQCHKGMNLEPPQVFVDRLAEQLELEARNRTDSGN